MLGSPAYPSYRIFLATALAALISLVLMPFFIKLMKLEHLGQQVRADGPGTHLVKQGTPTMGGIIILLAAIIATLIQAYWTPALKLAVIATVLTGSLGLLDDIESVAHKRSLGLTPAQKMLGLGLISLGFCTYAVNFCYVQPTIEFPGGATIDLGVFTSYFLLFGKWMQFPWLYLVFVFLLMAGLSNAVNLTDGLDGLAGGCSMVVFLIMAMVAFSYNEANLAVFAASLAGAIVGFLWYNCHPAQIFMGDTGSLGLGAAFAALAVLTKTEVSSLVMGGLFIVEALSVMIQVLSFKLTGKRVFLMAPIHHHFEKKGWSETKVVIRFWIVSAAFAALGFALYFQLG